MPKKRIEARQLTVRFRMSYDKTVTLKQKATEVVRRLLHRYRPRYFIGLDAIDLDLYEGDVVGVIGPNGCGKTTLLRTICGIYYPDAGRIHCTGRVSTLLSLGTGFDNRLNGLDNIRLNGLILGMSLCEIDDKIDEIVAFADIGEHIHMPMKYYSNGMISRLSFAIVLAMKPDILLIDEIFSVGDLAFQRKSERAIHQLLARASCQLIVTHDLDLVLNHCNRALYMRSAQIVMDGRPDEVVARYRAETGEASPRAAPAPSLPQPAPTRCPEPRRKVG